MDVLFDADFLLLIILYYNLFIPEKERSGQKGLGMIF